MTSSDGTHDTDEIWQMVQRMNDAWAKPGGPEDLASFFREDIVMVRPDFTQRTEGRDALRCALAAPRSRPRMTTEDRVERRVISKALRFR